MLWVDPLSSFKSEINTIMFCGNCVKSYETLKFSFKQATSKIDILLQKHRLILLFINIRGTRLITKYQVKSLRFWIHTLVLFCKFNNPTFRFISKRMMVHLKSSEICNLIVPNMCGVANQNTNITTCHFIPFYFFDDCL